MARLIDLAFVGALGALLCWGAWGFGLMLSRFVDERRARRAASKLQPVIDEMLHDERERAIARGELLPEGQKGWPCSRPDHHTEHGHHLSWSEARLCDFHNRPRITPEQRSAAVRAMLDAGSTARAKAQAAPTTHPARKAPTGWPPQSVDGLGP
jgi:hypothetical protein